MEVPSTVRVVDEKINWPLVLLLTGFGVITAIGGLAVADFDRSAFSGLLIEIGAGVGLVATVVLIERRLIGRISDAASAVATETVRTETAGLQERIVRLENLDEAHEQERAHRRTSNEATVQRVLNDELTAAAVGELLVDAIEDRLLVDDTFGVRTGTAPDSPVLYFCALSAANGVAALWLDFEPLMISNQPIDVPDLGEMFAPRGTDSTVMWIHDETAAEVASGLEAGLERTNTPANGFSFSYALTQLATSIEIMRVARAAPADDPRRLQGKLILLVNDDWVITTAGLESLSTPNRFPINAGAFGNLLPRHVRLPDGFDETLTGWEEAQTWLTERQSVTILRGDEQLESPFSDWAQNRHI